MRWLKTRTVLWISLNQMKSQSLEILYLLYAYKSNKIKQKQNLENVELENLFVF